MSHSLSPTDEGQSVVSIALLFGAVCFFAAVTVAESNPATTYEVSIYRSTPLIFWAGVSVSLLIGVGALVLATSWIQWAGGLALAGLSMLSVVALPIIRGYFFMGLTDPLRHLGNIRRLVSGETSFFAEVYPGSYSFVGFLSALSGIPLEQSMLIVNFAGFFVYTIFVVLVIRTILPHRRAVGIATVSALMFLPLNQISLHPHFHMFSVATFLTPILLYIVIKHITDRGVDDTVPGRFSSTDIAFAVAAVALVFYHPQVTVNVIIILAVIAVIQRVSRRHLPESYLSRSPPVYGQLLFLFAVFMLWNLQHEALFRLSSNLLESLNGLVMGTQQGGQVVTNSVDSAESVGLSVTEIFFKLFLVPAVYVLVAGAVIAVHLFSEQFEGSSEVVATVFSVSGVALGLFSLAHFVGDMSGYFFRHLGFGMVLVTILASIGFARAGDHIDELRSLPAQVAKVAAVVGVVVALLLSLFVVFPSPYIVLPNQHVSEQMYSGHEVVFEHRAEGAAVAATRGTPERYAQAMGIDLDPRLAWGVPPEALPSDLRQFRGHDFPTREFYYYIQTHQAKQKEVVAYRGLRYDEGDFTDVGETPGVSQVMTNGNVHVYHVRYGEGPTIGYTRLESTDLAEKPSESLRVTLGQSSAGAATKTQLGGVPS
jgi:hypothetical protein